MRDFHVSECPPWNEVSYKVIFFFGATSLVCFNANPVIKCEAHPECNVFNFLLHIFSLSLSLSLSVDPFTFFHLSPLCLTLSNALCHTPVYCVRQRSTLSVNSLDCFIALTILAICRYRYNIVSDEFFRVSYRLWCNVCVVDRLWSMIHD